MNGFIISCFFIFLVFSKLSENCEIDIQMNSLPSTWAKYNAWSEGVSHLSWHGPEATQGTYNNWPALGIPAAWTSNDPANALFHSDNLFGDHYWLVDMNLDCDQTENGWFEFKTIFSLGGKCPFHLPGVNLPWLNGDCVRIKYFSFSLQAKEVNLRSHKVPVLVRLEANLQLFPTVILLGVDSPTCLSTEKQTASSTLCAKNKILSLAFWFQSELISLNTIHVLTVELHFCQDYDRQS